MGLAVGAVADRLGGRVEAVEPPVMERPAEVRD